MTLGDDTDRTMTNEPRYTLAEAQHELNQRKCANHGHNFRVELKLGSGAPRLILCERCGRSWSINDKEPTG